VTREGSLGGQLLSTIGVNALPIYPDPMTATSYPNRDASLASREPASPARRITGVLRIIAGLLVLVAVITQITDQVLSGVFQPTEYFSYFTVLSSLINVIVLVSGGVIAVRWRRDTEFFTAVRMSTVAYAAVTAVVYNLLLRDLPGDGFVGLAWPGEVLHVWIPVFIVLDWLFGPGRPALGWGRIWLAIGFPLAWVAFTLVRGVVTDWYPYPFLDPDGPEGPVSVIVYIVAIAFFIIAVACVAIALSRVGRSVLAERDRERDERDARERAERERAVAERMRGASRDAR
jgi:uncharacterized membrane protein